MLTRVLPAVMLVLVLPFALPLHAADVAGHWQFVLQTDGGPREAPVELHLLAAGHGLPISGDHLAAALENFARAFTPPQDGRYVREPAVADERGVVHLPPPVADPVGAAMRTAGGVAAVVALMATIGRARRH